jgi:hypothetical protein
MAGKKGGGSRGKGENVKRKKKMYKTKSKTKQQQVRRLKRQMTKRRVVPQTLGQSYTARIC